MTIRIFQKATALWLLILALAFLNGALREVVLIPAWGRAPGLFGSGLLLSSAVLLMAWIGAPWYGPITGPQRWGIGVYWLLLTMTFETGINLVGGKPWNELLSAYTFKDGNLWTLVLLVILVAPTAAARLRARSAS